MIYLDNAATGFPKPRAVLRKTLSTLTAPLGNPGRSGHPLSVQASDLVFRAREKIAQLIGLKLCEQVVFCSGATAALNMAIRGITRALNQRGRIPFVVTSVFEHNSVLRPLFDLEREGRIHLWIPTPEPNGNMPAEDILQKAPDLIVLTLRSNLTGHHFPLKNVFDQLRRQGTLVILDAAQKLGSGECTFDSTGADILCAPGHKGLMGLMGGGFLAVSETCPLLPEAIFAGGSGNDSFNPFMPHYLPERLEAGTLPLLAIASMMAGAEYLLEVGVEEIEKKEREAKQILTEGILEMRDFVIYEPWYKGGPLLINHKALPPEEVSMILAKSGIMTRAGYHCAPLGHRYLGTESRGALRLSPGPFTETRDLIKTLDVLSTIH